MRHTQGKKSVLPGLFLATDTQVKYQAEEQNAESLQIPKPESETPNFCVSKRDEVHCTARLKRTREALF